MSYAPAQGGQQPPYAPNFPAPQGQPGMYPQPEGYHPGSYPQPGYPAPQGYNPVPQNPYGPGYQPTPIVQQPTPGQPMGYGQPGGGWMNIPQGVPNCPSGLEYLSMIDQLLVHQKVEVLEALTGFETNNKYTVKNGLGQKVYYAVEENDCCTRNCFGSLRPFEMKILDNYGTQVINLSRALACESCCFPCCLQKMEVRAPPGNTIGYIEQQWSLCMPAFDIKNASGDTVLKIEGPLCTCSICGNVDFQVKSKDGETTIGKISKQWSGLLREYFTDSDYFGITFPVDLDVKIKAVLLGACFLIDAMYFEKGPGENSRSTGILRAMT